MLVGRRPCGADLLESCRSSPGSNDISSVGIRGRHDERVRRILTAAPTPTLQHVQKTSLELLCNTQHHATAAAHNNEETADSRFRPPTSPAAQPTLVFIVEQNLVGIDAAAVSAVTFSTPIGINLTHRRPTA